MRWDRIIEEKIRQAQAEGKFKNLPGQGRPLRLDDEPGEDSDWWAAHHLLKAGGFRPDWLEDDLTLRQQLQQAREALARSRDWHQEQLLALGDRQDAEALEGRNFLAGELARARERFMESVARINRGIANLNLKVPHERFQRLPVALDDELRRLGVEGLQ